jgi:outer membrane protein assembly factor BamB
MMKLHRWLFSGILMVNLGIAQAQFDASFVPSALSSDLLWGKWGNDLRNSHYNPNAAGPTNPRLLWSLAGGLIDEPLIDGSPLLWAPVHPYSTSLRFTQYRQINPSTGRILGTLGPYWGQATTPLIFQTAVYARSGDGTFVDFVPDYPVWVLSGGQYDVLVYSPDPLGIADVFWIGTVGVPAYRSGLTAYTDGASGYFVLADNAGAVRPVMVFWVVDVDAGQSYPYLYIDQPINSPAGAVYSVAGSSSYSADLLVSTHHSGTILVYDTKALGAPAQVGELTLSDLSQATPEDSTPIDSDICDRPAVISADNSTLFVCATNNGRVYAVNLLDGTKLWVTELGKAIMAGPAIAPDPSNGGEETLYVVTRETSTRSGLVAIRALDGVVKWRRTLQNVSRCNPTVDANGRIFIGDDRGYLYAINPNGSILWTRYLGAAIRVAPVLAALPSPAGTVDVLYVAASNRMLYAFVETTPIRIPPGEGDIVPRIGGGAQSGW